MVHPVITDVEGFEVSDKEKDLFKKYPPFGFILFKRNCDTPDQVKALTTEMRDICGNDDLPILIDQEGGRVARLGPPNWKKYPAAGVYADLYDDHPNLAVKAVSIHAMLMAAELINVGVNVDCYPVADILYAGADKVIGNRAYGDFQEKVSILARAAAEGMIVSGVTPIIKHIPGHGRADVDSHLSLPIVDTPRDELSLSDFMPFKALNDLPCAMTAHVIYSDIDAEKCATISSKVITEVIRQEIGFEGVLISDDLSMKALNKTAAENALDALNAGCDLALHCNGTLKEREAVLKATEEMVLADDNKLNEYFRKKRQAKDIDQDMLYNWLSDVIKGYE